MELLVPDLPRLLLPIAGHKDDLGERAKCSCCAFLIHGQLEIVNRAGCPIRRGWPWQDGDQSCSGTYLAVSCSVCFTFDGGDKVPCQIRFWPLTTPWR